MKILRRILFVVIVLGLVALIGYRASMTYQARKKQMAQAAPEKIIPVEAVQPSKAQIVEKIKEKYRGETGASYDRDVWVVHVKEGLAIPYKYVLALGGLLVLVGVGKLII